MSLLQKIINFILPPRCLICGKVLDSNKGVCDSCISKIEFINDNICYRCGHPLTEAISASKDKHFLCGNCIKSNKNIFRLSRSACVYDDFSKKLILDFKFYDKTDLSSFLAKMLYVCSKDIFDAGVDIIIPVPLHYTRLIKRRYNQSALMAKELSKLTNIPVDYTTVIKSKKTRPQVECKGNERLKNLQGAFEIKDISKLKNKRVLLIDDVLTTGSTLKECSKAILKSKPKSIDWLTVTRVV